MNPYDLLVLLPTVISLAGTNIYPMILPDQCTYPALTHQIIARVSNPGLNTRNMLKQRVQFECYAKTYLLANTLRCALIEAIGPFSGQVGELYIQAAQVISQYDYYEDEIELYRLVTEAYFWFN